MKHTLESITQHFRKYNDMEYNAEIGRQMAKILVQRFGFEDSKYYTHVNKVVQMFDWKKGDGTLFLVKDGLRYKYEIGQSYDDNGKLSNKGWFLADIEAYDIKTYHGESFQGGQNKKMTFLLTR